MIIPVLLSRCEKILRTQISDGQPFDTEKICEEILSQFGEMLAEDGATPSEALDYYECRFNHAFRTFRINICRQEENRLKKVASLPEPIINGEPETEEEALARSSEAARIPAAQESNLLESELWQAIYALPPDERKAVILCRYLGYKVESENPDVMTAAKHCGCSGRTIRNRLDRAAKKLSQFTEDI